MTITEINKQADASVWCPQLTGEAANQGWHIAKAATGELYHWSGKFLPKIGDRVNVDMNGIGPATVMGYFALDGFLGVWVDPDVMPEYIIRQRKAEKYTGPFGYWFVRGYVTAFGVEIEAL